LIKYLTINLYLILKK